MSAESIRILIVDDHPLVRQGLRAVLDAEPGFEVVGEAENGQAAVELARKCSPSVILMDLLMPEMDGVEACRRILDENDRCRILVWSGYGSERKLVPALESGALGLLTKDAVAPELIEAIRVVARGSTALSPAIARHLRNQLSTETPTESSEEALTGRETDVLRELASGLSNEEIADKLFISASTVRTHLNHLFQKLNLTRRTQAVLYALRHGIADLGA